MFQNIVYLLISVGSAMAICGAIHVALTHTVRNTPRFIAKMVQLEIKTEAGLINLVSVGLGFFLILHESLFEKISPMFQGRSPNESPVLMMYICLSATTLGSLIIVGLLEKK